ncbi:MAG: type II toxin-antitoxin system HipA family toxin [Chitinophagaceae bacterium]|nr:type II toxin-antitoxin system HipA family toxin [Chitinophagaceae bacterium]
MDINVYADWQGIKNAPALVGTLTIVHTKGHQVTSFEYSKDWLKQGVAQNLDPDLLFYSGPQYLGENKPNFGLFADSSPDRWGRTLVDRREAILARQEGRKPKKLFEEDYLLGVYDVHRMGGLRFKIEGSDDFQHADRLMAAPPWTSLRELEQASLALENDLLKDTETLKWINMLIAPGASLGGARPKASVIDQDGHLWIAKFPSVNDTHDVAGWEMVAADLAMQCGINMARTDLRQFNSKHHTFLSKRFDRSSAGERIHFASAMTLLGKTDGATGTSYLDLVEFIMQQGAAPAADLEQLWRRIVFYIAIHNTDDHLRNHGFILTPQGWSLSPAYDVNPVYHGVGLSLNITSTDNSLDMELAREVAPYFRVADASAKQRIADTQKTVSNWKKLAEKYHVPSKDHDLMVAAFE